MATVEVTPLGDGRTEVRHPASGAVVATAGSPEWGGPGGAFSATDLVAAALGACIGSSIEGVLSRRGIGPEGVTVSVTKHLADDPKRIVHLEVAIDLPPECNPAVVPLVERAAASCAVGRSLAATESVTVRIG